MIVLVAYFVFFFSSFYNFLISFFKHQAWMIIMYYYGFYWSFYENMKLFNFYLYFFFIREELYILNSILFLGSTNMINNKIFRPSTVKKVEIGKYDVNYIKTILNISDAFYKTTGINRYDDQIRDWTILISNKRKKNI